MDGLGICSDNRRDAGDAERNGEKPGPPRSSPPSPNVNETTTAVAGSWIAACRFRWMLSASLRLCGGFPVAAWLTLFALFSTNFSPSFRKDQGAKKPRGSAKVATSLSAPSRAGRIAKDGRSRSARWWLLVRRGRMKSSP